jgi:D-lactate dehydrogenase
MKTLVYSIHGFDKATLEKSAAGKIELVFTEQPLNTETAHLSKGFEAIVLFTADIANAEVLELLKANGVKYIALRSAGYDHVDLAKAKELNIKVANVPAYSPYAIAEHAVTLLLTLNRNILKSQALMNKNDFRLDQLIGFDLNGKTIGIVGTGKTGEVFAKIMNGFGCKLLGYDIQENKKLIQQTNITYTSLEKMCQQADVISIHCPLNENTNYLFDKKLFSIMKKGVYIINIARGGIINTIDLMDAIDQGIVAAAGLDVYENEKQLYFYDHTNTIIKDEVFEKLRAYPNVLLTPHQAFLTNEALQGIANTTINNLTQWKTSGTSKNELY